MEGHRYTAEDAVPGRPVVLRSGSHADARERRERYYELRRQGLGVVDAAAQVGVLETSTVYRYERWFQAVERGAVITGRQGGAAGGGACGA